MSKDAKYYKSPKAEGYMSSWGKYGKASFVHLLIHTLIIRQSFCRSSIWGGIVSVVRIEKNSTLFLLSLQFVKVQGENATQNGP